jgi:hypothetical protein
MATDKICVVYWIFNDQCVCILRHGYVGVTTGSLRKRHVRHIREDRVPEDTSILVLFSGTPYQCRKREWELRQDWYIGWNTAPGGGSHRRNIVVGAETRKLMSKSAKARGSNWDLMSDEDKEKQRLRMLGSTNKGRIGQQKTEEEKAKISATRLERNLSWSHMRAYWSERLKRQPGLHTGHLHSEQTKETIRQKKTGVAVHTEQHKRELSERWKGNSLTKGKPWSVARRLAWLQSKEA